MCSKAAAPHSGMHCHQFHHGTHTVRPRQNGHHFADNILTHFHQWKSLIFNKNFIEACSLWSNWQQVIIGSEHGLASYQYLNQWWSCSLMHICIARTQRVKSLRPRQNGRLFTDDTFKRSFLNENIRISTKNSLKFVPKGLINNIPALVQIMACRLVRAKPLSALFLIMAWRRPDDKPLSEPMLVRSLTHICVTRPQWVKEQPLPNCTRK